MWLKSCGRILISFFLTLACCHTARADWTGEIYGGRYYDDNRFGSYLVLSSVKPEGPILIAEALYENYTGYEFAGIGGHFLWPVEETVNIGIVASQSWETTEFIDFGDFDYESRTAGIELEFDTQKVTLAAQAGRFYTGFDETTSPYLSADLYAWSSSRNWYLRGATRWISTDSLYFIEGYHSNYLIGFPVTGYIGTSVFNSNILANVIIDSVYIGGYVELLSTPYSTLFLWTEVAEFDGEVLLTLELSFGFGPGARTPYITAFGFPIDRRVVIP